jgi:hypothetical protein
MVYLARRPYLPLAILLAAVLVLFARVLFTTGYEIPWDFRGFHLPLASAVFDAMQGNGSVLWDPTSYCGRPLFADPQAQVFYPPSIVAVWFATWLGSASLVHVLEWQLALHVFAAGAFTYLMLRRLGVSQPAALCGGLIFELGGFFVSQTEHLGAIDGVAWIPLMWTAAFELRRVFRGPWFAVLAGAVALTVLAGFPAVTSTALVATGIYAGTLVCSHQMRWRGLVAVLAGCVCGLGLSAIMLAPAIQLALLSVAQYRTDWFTGWGFPPKYLISLLLPPARDVRCDLLYCGIAALPLAVWSVAVRKSRTLVIPIASVALLSGIWMVGTATWFGRAVWAATPALARGSLYPHYAMATFCLAIAVLAAIGLDHIPRLSAPHKYAIAVLTAIDLLAVGFGRPMHAIDVRLEPGITREQFEGSAATMRSLRELDKGQPPGRFDTSASQVTYSDTAPLTRLPSASGYNPMVLERLTQVRLSFAHGYRWGAWYQVEDLDSPMIDALNVRWLMSGRPVSEGRFHRVAAFPGFLLYENRHVLPRFWLVHEVRCAHTPEQAFLEIHRADFRPAAYAVVESAQAVSSGAEGEVRLQRYAPREISLNVRSGAPSFLATSETHYPGWHASIDGSDTPIVMTNGAFRGLFVPAGDHVVRFQFTPRILYLGASISAVFFCAVVFIALRKPTPG